MINKSKQFLKSLFLPYSIFAIGSGTAIILSSFDKPFLGAIFWALALIVSFLILQSQIKNFNEEKRTLRLVLSEESDSDKSELAHEIVQFLKKVDQQGNSIRDVVRYLQEHATLVAWVIDSLDHAIEEVNAQLGKMVENANHVNAQGVKVMDGAKSGREFMETINLSSEDLSNEAERLSVSAKEADSAINKIQRAIQTIEEAITKLSEMSDHSTSFVAEVGGTMSDIRKRTKQSQELLERVAAYTERGRKVVREVGMGVGEIKRSSQETMRRIDELTSQSKGIEQVLGIIVDVADETNLLSLNAAILAAQAGEKGAAFAVVADQIRNLSHRTRESVQNIENIVRDLQENMVIVSERMGQSLTAVEKGEGLGNVAVEQLDLIERAVVESVGQARHIAEVAQNQDDNSTKMISNTEEVNKALHGVTEGLKRSTVDVAKISKLVGSFLELADSLKSSTALNHRSALEVSKLMSAFEVQVREIDQQILLQRDGISKLDSAMADVAESASSTKESLSSIHTIVTELVGYADAIKDEVKTHLPPEHKAEETHELKTEVA